MSRTRAEIQADIDQEQAAVKAYQRDIDEAVRGQRCSLDNERQLLAELAKTHYGDDLLATLVDDPKVRDAELLDSCGAPAIAKVISRAAHGVLNDVEIYVKIDPALLSDLGISSHALSAHLWPIVATTDRDGDVVLHVTSGDRAQS